ncbi:XRE family transcriptional regulator [Streptomyces sp. GZWMJZ-114]|uniref:XRE family transcriptional regulator n=1 Tax=Streptomyces sp. GZWMJZ-114 TaxID=2494734 RepID=UPI0010126748|nr:XRE family transcriptional regulator [Streptomyces sp. GZWMJZ-114]
MSAAATAPVLGLHATGEDPQTGEILVSGLRDAMLGLGRADPRTADQLAAELDRARSDYRTGAYTSCAVRLPRLLSTAHALPAPDPALLSHTYLIATRILIKLDEQQLGWMAADRARQCAATAGQPLVLAETARQQAVLARKAGWTDQALTLALDAGDDPALHRHGHAGLAVRGLLIQSAAYTLAWTGDQAGMRELITEAAHLAQSAPLTSSRGLGLEDFTSATVQLHLISAEYRAGDPAAAITAAEGVDTTRLTAERRARLHTDRANAFIRWGRCADAIDALLAAERNAPQETHARPAVRSLISGLLLSRRVTPDLRRLAGRSGIAL